MQSLFEVGYTWNGYDLLTGWLHHNVTQIEPDFVVVVASVVVVLV